MSKILALIICGSFILCSAKGVSPHELPLYIKLPLTVMCILLPIAVIREGRRRRWSDNPSTKSNWKNRISKFDSGDEL